MLPEYAVLNLLLLLALWLLLPVISPFNRRWRAVILWPLIFVQLYYLYWRCFSTLEPFALSANVLWQYLFFLSEMLVVVYGIWQCIMLLRYTDRSHQCDLQIAKTSGSYKRSVDLFIPTHSESKAILSETITAAKRDYYPDLTIWICDDGNRRWLRELCMAQCVNYLQRPAEHLPRTKAGNLNWSIRHGQADYVVCLDADFQPTTDLSTRLTSLLGENRVGLVQAPQHFRNLDPIQRNLLGGSAWTEEQRFFFDIGLPSRDAWGNALCVGSCWAARRDVIEEIGGFPIDSIVEDVYFGYRVKSAGYRTVYLNERLATGLAAEDTPSYVVQRSRWCLGAMTLLRAPHGPFRAAGLSVKDRLFYLEISLYWITHLHLLLLLIAPAVYGFLGYNVFNCSTEDLFSVLLPKNILFCAAFYWVSQGRCMPIITPVQKTLTIFSVIPAILRGICYPDTAKFHVTKKDIHYDKRTVHWKLAGPFIIIGVLTLISMSKVLSQNYNNFYWSDYSAYNTMLSAYSLIAVFLCCLICVDKPSDPNVSEFETPLHGNWWKTSLAITSRMFR